MSEQEWTKNSISVLLRKHGLRVTSPRLAICMRLLERHCHYTAQQMHEVLLPQHPTLSPNTVYLTLNQLASVGVIRCFNVAGNAVYDSNTTLHDHAHCRRCGTLENVTNPSPDQETTNSRMPGWNLEWGTRLWSGLCPECK